MGVYNGNIYAGVNTYPEKSGTKNVGEIEVTKNEYGEFSLIIKKMKTATGLFPDFSIDKVSFKDRADGSIQIVHTPGIVEIPRQKSYYQRCNGTRFQIPYQRKQ